MPPVQVCVPPLVPRVKVPSVIGVKVLTTVDPLPLKTIFATVLPNATKVVISTSPDKVAVPPTLLKVRVVTPLIFPDAVMLDPVTLFSVVKVKVLEPPVMAAIVMSALLVVVELVSMVVAVSFINSHNH